tara:strand:- start:139 stop:561 length:423 start_codon:yes stop_codon:yes gene_type:complete
MRKFQFFTIFLFLLFFSNNSYAARYGTGELKLSDRVVSYFIQYIRGKQFKYPATFLVTIDGSDAVSWYCSEMTNCSSGSISQDLATCLRVTGKECGQFARQRYIKWNNGVNPGKGKISQIKNKWSDQEIKSHLKKLGFID